MRGCNFPMKPGVLKFGMRFGFWLLGAIFGADIVGLMGHGGMATGGWPQVGWKKIFQR